MLHQAIYNLYTQTISIEGYDNVKAFDVDGNSVTLDESLIQAEVTRLQAIYDNNQYQRDRQYAPTGDQLDMLWHSIDAGEFGDTAKQSEFYTANKAVKDANPKG
jgi:hypothetical protein